MTEERPDSLRNWLQFSLSVIGALIVVGAAWASLTARLAVIETKLEGIALVPSKVEANNYRLNALERDVEQLKKEKRNGDSKEH